jgi:type III secretion protein R
MVQLNEVTGLLVTILAISLLPFVAMVVSSYAKVVVVLGLLRNALGVQQVPPNMVINGLAILVSVYVMAPIGLTAAKSLEAQSGTMQPVTPIVQIFDATREPFRQFLNKHSNEREKKFFLRSASKVWPKEEAQQLREDDLIVLAPAFALTEMTDAFKIGFILYITFIIIDFVIANILLAMGLNQINPTNVAIPFKLLLFVVMDGWSILIHGLIMTYR